MVGVRLEPFAADVVAATCGGGDLVGRAAVDAGVGGDEWCEEGEEGEDGEVELHGGWLCEVCLWVLEDGRKG